MKDEAGQATVAREFHASRGNEQGTGTGTPNAIDGVWGPLSKPDRLEIVLDRPRYVPGTAAEPLLAQLMCLEELRVEQAPPPPVQWAVRWPLPPPADMTAPVRITYPYDSGVFLALDGRAVIQPPYYSPFGLGYGRCVALAGRREFRRPR